MKTSGYIVIGCRKAKCGMLCVLLLLLAALPLLAQEGAKPETETYSAMLAGQSGPLAGKTTTLTIHIKEYSSDQEVQQLAETLRTNGPDGLLKAVDKLGERGRIAPPRSTGTAVQVVRQHPMEGGRRVILFANRPISFAELRGATRSRDYPFGLAILNLNAKDEGEGLLYGACKVRFNKDNELEVEHYGTAPARLLGVKRMK